jgi:hypothetical protein
MVITYALTAHLRTSFNSAPQTVCTYVHATGVVATVFHASSSKHRSPQRSWHTSRRRHHDARQRLRPARIHQHSSDTKTPLRHAVETQCDNTDKLRISNHSKLWIDLKVGLLWGYLGGLFSKQSSTWDRDSLLRKSWQRESLQMEWSLSSPWEYWAKITSSDGNTC